MQTEVSTLEEFAATARSAGVQEVLLLGMGGSSLAPEVFQATFGSQPGAARVTTVDTTHPSAIQRLSDRIDPATTWVIVSSKSGGTLETASLHQYFWGRFSDALSEPEKHFIVITDPGTALDSLAQARSYRAVFRAPADVGGRFSALSFFGLVPASLIGGDVGLLLARAREVLEPTEPVEADPKVGVNEALEIGALLGELAAAGRDKLTAYASNSVASFPDWLEQLVAESSGKKGKGILPVVGEPFAPTKTYGSDRLFVAFMLENEENARLEQHLAALEASGYLVMRRVLRDRYDLGSEMLIWEIAVAAACSILGCPPFNQPDVQLAKEMAQKAMQEPDSGGPGGTESSGASGVGAIDIADRLATRASVHELLQDAQSGGYIAVLAYLAPAAEVTMALGGLQAALQRRTGLAVTVGYGPRYLHSTGQLHKGGAKNGHFLQLVDRPTNGLAVPQSDFTFDRLIEAQALGDLRALRSRRQKTLRLVMTDSPAKDLTALSEALNG
jgi:transaldolase/glucose-6-phosphate isomerase